MLAVMTGAGCERRLVVYSGRVQGVGFRYTTLGISRSFAVTGYVLNLPDGRVELVADGDPDVVDRFLAAVRDRLGDYIDRAEVNRVAREETFSTFAIRY